VKSFVEANLVDKLTANNTNSDNEKAPLFVIDGQNVAMEYAGNILPASGLGIYLIVKHFQNLGYRVQAYVPGFYLDERLDNPPTHMDLLKELNHEGLLRTTPPADRDDDKYIIYYAQKAGGYVVSKDRFNKQLRALPDEEQDEFRKWRDEFVISNFTFGDEMFILDPDYELPPLPPRVELPIDNDEDSTQKEEEVAPIETEDPQTEGHDVDVAREALHVAVRSWLGDDKHNWTKFGVNFPTIAKETFGRDIGDRRAIMEYVGISMTKSLRNQMDELMEGDIEIKMKGIHPQTIHLKKGVLKARKKEPEANVESADPPHGPLSLDEFKAMLTKQEFSHTNRYQRDLPSIIQKTFPFFRKVEYPINKARLGNLFKKVYGKKINDVYGSSDNLAYFISSFGLAHTHLISKGDVFRLKGYLEWREMDQEELLGIIDQATDEELHGIMYRLAAIGDDDVAEPLIEYIENVIKKEEKPYGRGFDGMLELFGKLKSPKAVPYLLEQLKLPDRDVQESVIYALGEIGDESAKEPLLKLLKNPDYPHDSIIRSLGIIGGEDIIDHLHPFLESDEWLTFQYTLDALKNVGSKESFEPLWSQYTKRIGRPVETKNIFDLMKDLDPVELEHRLFRLLDSKSDGVRKRIARHYSDVSPKRDLDSLINLLSDPDPEFRNWIGHAILHHLSEHGGDDRLIQTIVPLLDSENEFVREEAIGILMFQLKEDSLLIIQPYIDDKSELVRRAIAHQACFRLAPDDSIPILVKMIQDDDFEVQTSALYGLHHYYFDDVAKGYAKENGIPIPKNLVAFARSEKQRYQEEAIQALGQLWLEDSLGILISLKEHPKQHVRVYVANAFGTIGNNECWGHLVDMMDDEDPGVKTAVGGAFYQLKLEDLDNPRQATPGIDPGPTHSNSRLLKVSNKNPHPPAAGDKPNQIEQPEKEKGKMQTKEYKSWTEPMNIVCLHLYLYNRAFNHDSGRPHIDLIKSAEQIQDLFGRSWAGLKTQVQGYAQHDPNARGSTKSSKGRERVWNMHHDKDPDELTEMANGVLGTWP